MTFLVVLGLLAAALQVAGYGLYLRNFLKRAIRPNAASFLMFAYGTSFLLFLEYKNNATWELLALPAVCAVISVFVAGLCFRRNATERTDRVEALAFSTDLWLTVAYAALALGLADPTRFHVGFLIATNLTALTCFVPIIRSTWQAPYRELPGPWLVWTLAYATLGLATWLADGGRNPVLLVYPLLNMVLHGIVALLTLREEVKVTRYFDRAKTLYLQRSFIDGVGVFAGRAFARGAPIWKMSGRLVEASSARSHPNFIGIGPGKWVDPDAPFDRLNHSCVANAAFGPRRQLYALRAIEPGEEITLDYSTTEADPEWAMACRCEAPTCRRHVFAIQVSFADAVAAPAASPLMQLVWRTRRSLGVAAPVFPQLAPVLESDRPAQFRRIARALVRRRGWLPARDFAGRRPPRPAPATGNSSR